LSITNIYFFLLDIIGDDMVKGKLKDRV